MYVVYLLPHGSATDREEALPLFHARVGTEDEQREAAQKYRAEHRASHPGALLVIEHEGDPDAEPAGRTENRPTFVS